jgi:hypothetical protein
VASGTGSDGRSKPPLRPQARSREPATPIEFADAAIADAVERRAVTSGLRFEQLTEGRCAHVMQLGPHAEEGPTIERLLAFIAAEGLSLGGHHHESY